MGKNPDSAEQLRAVDEAPVLTKGASVAERGLGVLSAALVFTVLVLAASHEVAAVLGGVVLLVTLAVVLRWRWFHLRAPGRRPHGKIEDWVSFLTPVALAIPALRILWNNPTDLPAAMAGATVPTVLLAVYLVLRWRR
ncbi:hypothetical protein [Streptomyces sp. NBC_00286]|uniref:hypothetical protein n=1 Tax=Streptomyces sp. NBC_00286 TaxID=2975701 RepID=UPI002E2BF6CF|nr:hypothetical protein [Streptomyces sp. NBC_00286]